MKTVLVEVRKGIVQHVKCPRGVSVQVLDFDALSGTGQPEKNLWEGEEWIESRLLQAAKDVVAKIERAGFSETCLDGTDIREAIAEAEEQQGEGDRL